ncbi:MAG: hypothetical protein RLZZ316_514, partial [Bacteroidota bacterium]
MIYHRPFSRLVVRSLFFLSILCVSVSASAQDGKALFEANCKSCHAIDANLTGPALRGVEDRVPDQKLLYAWIKNNQAVLASGNKYFNDLYKQWNKTAMNTFTGLADADIAAILKYVSEAPKAGDKKGGPVATKEESADNSLLYGILTLILAIITLILLQVNSNLRKLADDKDGIPSAEPIAFYKNKSYIAVFAVVLFVIGGYLTIQGAVGLGRNKDYQPEQPIYYSHKVHAGTNQISC